MKARTILICLFLSACNLEEQKETYRTIVCDSGSQDFIGCWSTNDCLQASDGQGNYFDRWYRSEYSFRNNGTFEDAGLKYDNALCSGAPTYTGVNEKLIKNYSVVEQRTNSQGLEITVIQLPVESFWIKAGLYITAENQLCTTDNLSLQGGTYRYSGSVLLFDDTIVFENCLSKGLVNRPVSNSQAP